VLVVAAVALIGLWLAVGRPNTPRLVGNTVALLAFTALLSYSRATSGLTQWHSYAAAVFVLLVLGELLVGRRVGNVVTIVVAAIVVWSIVWNLGELSEGADLQRWRAEEMRAQLAAVEIGRGAIDADYDVGRLLLATRAGPYLAVADEYGSPAYDLDELRRAPAHARRAADVVLVEGAGVTTEQLPEGSPCPASTTAEESVLVPAADRRVRVRARVFSDGVRVATVPPHSTLLVRLPRIPGHRWEVRATEDGSDVDMASVCASDV
jgi:hypothetical protein